MTNCKNCGAILKSTICEYCGTNYGTPILNEKDCTIYASDSDTDIITMYADNKVFAEFRRSINGRDL